MALNKREWTPPPAVDPRTVAKKEPGLHMYAPLLYGPALPLIRIGLRGRLPQRQVDAIFLTGIGIALSHAGFIMFSDSSV